MVRVSAGFSTTSALGEISTAPLSQFNLIQKMDITASNLADSCTKPENFPLFGVYSLSEVPLNAILFSVK